MTLPITTLSTRGSARSATVEITRTASNLGIRVLVDLVLNHTSNQHPWFQEARRDRNSRYRDYYRWSDKKRSEPSEIAFPGAQKSTWSYDDVAGQWYMHRYFDFMPELNITEPNVRDEMNKVLGFWLELASPDSGSIRFSS
jgi:maltose alpha-D-glucosyltransferase/alpha-amylase